MKVEKRIRKKTLKSAETFKAILKSEKVDELPLCQINDQNQTIIEEELSPSPATNLESIKLNESKGEETPCELSTLVTSLLDSADENFEEPQVIPQIEEEKVKPKRKIKWSQYEKKYKASWENEPKLAGWVCRHPSDPGKVYCKYCCCVLRAHKTDLYKHCSTVKHQKAEAKYVPDNEANDISKKFILLQKPKEKTKLKTEKVLTPDGTVIIVQSEQGVLCPEREANIFMDCSDTEPREETIVSESMPRSNLDQEIADIANQIGFVLINDIEKILKTQKNVLKFFKSNKIDGEPTFSEANVRKMTRICVGHLAQKYLIESALESSQMKSPVFKGKRELTTKFQAIEEKLETTMSEMKNLKMSFDGVSDVLPFTPIDLSHFLTQPSSSQHG